MTTIYTDVPARRIHKGRVCTTKVYRALMARIGRAIKSGADVTFASSFHDLSGREGAIVERISVTIGEARQSK